MKPKTTNRIYKHLAIFILLMAVMQSPILYYYDFGILMQFFAPFYIVVGASLNLLTLNMVVRSKLVTNKGLLQFMLFSSVIIGLLSSAFGDYIVEQLDWSLRLKTRVEIIREIKCGMMEPNVKGNNTACMMSNWIFPPISNGGNEIFIEKTDSIQFTVTFLITPGFLDHYNAFVYTNDRDKIVELDYRTTNIRKGGNWKIGNGWYRVSY